MGFVAADCCRSSCDGWDLRVLGKRLPSVPTTELTKPPDVVNTTSSTTAGVGLTGRSDGFLQQAGLLPEPLRNRGWTLYAFHVPRRD